ncbi:unnamed protein product [Ceratitis capitata]|uniref:(Mediterranean fruit fly) hypothetical protein n=1 Tax=Ceratitis capitata TaxID=7213 RepID=A0A811ULV3_CERCA|nr:unnamed protein product [Ceratitis capitata]
MFILSPPNAEKKYFFVGLSLIMAWQESLPSVILDKEQVSSGEWEQTWDFVDQQVVDISEHNRVVSRLSLSKVAKVKLNWLAFQEFSTRENGTTTKVVHNNTTVASVQRCGAGEAGEPGGESQARQDASLQSYKKKFDIKSSISSRPSMDERINLMRKILKNYDSKTGTKPPEDPNDDIILFGGGIRRDDK